jgi:predicted secreted protein
LTRPDTSTVTKTLTTGTNGKATWNYKVNPKGQSGTYHVTAKATYGSQTATASTIDFLVP